MPNSPWRVTQKPQIQAPARTSVNPQIPSDPPATLGSTGPRPPGMTSGAGLSRPPGSMGPMSDNFVAPPRPAGSPGPANVGGILGALRAGSPQYGSGAPRFYQPPAQSPKVATAPWSPMGEPKQPMFQENNMGIHKSLRPSSGNANPAWAGVLGQSAPQPATPPERVRWRDTQTNLTPEQMAMSPQELAATLTPEQQAERQNYIQQQRYRQQRQAMQGADMLRGSQQRQWDPQLMTSLQRNF